MSTYVTQRQPRPAIRVNNWTCPRFFLKRVAGYLKDKYEAIIIGAEQSPFADDRGDRLIGRYVKEVRDWLKANVENIPKVRRSLTDAVYVDGVGELYANKATRLIVP